MRKIRFTEVVWPTQVTQVDDGEIKLEPKTSDLEYRDPSALLCAERSI